jgi:hypothetical protein
MFYYTKKLISSGSLLCRLNKDLKKVMSGKAESSVWSLPTLPASACPHVYPSQAELLFVYTMARWILRTLI